MPTKTIRVPLKKADELLAIAKDLDNGCYQNTANIKLENREVLEAICLQQRASAPAIRLKQINRKADLEVKTTTLEAARAELER